MNLALINIRFKADLTGFSSEMQNAIRTINQVGDNLKSAGQSLSTYLTAPILAAGGVAVKFASDFQESVNKVEVAFKSSSAGVKEFGKTTLEAYGISEGAALDMAALFGDMGTSMGIPVEAASKMSESLVGLAGDLSSFKNMALSEATTALNGIFSGETESLKRIGVVMTEANLAQFAMAQGIKTQIKDMTQAEKVNLRYAYVMSQTKNAQGDFARTFDGSANQMRVFQESLKQIGAQFGQIILPLFTKAISAVNASVKSFSKLSDETKRVIVVVAAFAAAIGPVIFGIGVLLKLVPVLATGYSFLTARIGAAAIATAYAALQTKALAIADGIAIISTQALAASQMLLAGNISGATQALRVMSATMATTPWGLLAVAIAAAAAAFFIFRSNSDDAKKAVTELSDTQKVMQRVTDEAAASIVDQKSKLETLLLTARNENETLRVRKNAIAEINKIAPEYLGNLTLENINTDNARIALEKYNAAILSGAMARAAQRQLDNAAADKIKAGFEREKAVAEYNAKRAEAAAKGWAEESKFLEENNRLLGFSNDALDRANAKYEFESKILLDIISKNQHNLKLVQETTVALAKLGPKPGTIEYYEQQISGLQKLQKEVSTTHASWKKYEDRIDAIQKKIDAIKKGPEVKFAKPEMPELTFWDNPEMPQFSLEELKNQKAYFEKLREQFSLTSVDYEKLTGQINNTQLKIKAIEGGDELVSTVELIKTKIVDFSNVITEQFKQLVANAAVAFGELLGNMVNGGAGMRDMLSGLLGLIGNFLGSLGEALIAAGIAGIAFKKLIEYPWAAVAAGIALIALSTVVKNTMSQGVKGYKDGGIVGGSSYYGDKVLARVNSGEMILNDRQQKRLYGMITPAVSAGDVAVQLMGGFKIDGMDLRLVLDRVDNKNKRIR